MIMRQFDSILLPALRRARLLARLRAEGAAALRQWPVFLFAACCSFEQPGHPAAVICATLVFSLIRDVIAWLTDPRRACRLTLTVTPVAEAGDEPGRRVPPICANCPRAAGERLRGSSLN